MKIYKFQDYTDGNYAFVLARTEIEAVEALVKTTSLKFKLIEAKGIASIEKPIIIRNNIVAF